MPVREEQRRAREARRSCTRRSASASAVQETQQVSGTVRREEARIESEGDVVVDGKQVGN